MLIRLSTFALHLAKTLVWDILTWVLIILHLNKVFHIISFDPTGVLGISSDGDDRRIFLGLKFSIPGFFGVPKFGLGSLIWVGIFGGIRKNR